MILITYLWAVPVCFIVHELGHLIAWAYFGIMPKRMVYSRLKLGIEYKADRQDLNRDTQFWGAFAGPLASATLAIAAMNAAPILSKASLAVAVINLLPIKGSDGRTIADLWRE